MKCVICEGDGKREPLYCLPLSLKELGYEGGWGHPKCVTACRSLFVKMAKRRDISLEQLVASQAR